MAIKNPERQTFSQSALFDSPEGVSVPVERYRDTKLELMTMLGKVARGEGLAKGIKYEVPNIQERLSTAPRVAIHRTEEKNEGRIVAMNRLLQRDELIEAGFHEGAVDKEFDEMREDLRKDYFGEANEKIRAKERRRLKNPIEYAEDDLEKFEDNAAISPVLSNGRKINDYRRDVRFFKFVRRK